MFSWKLFSLYCFFQVAVRVRPLNKGETQRVIHVINDKVRIRCGNEKKRLIVIMLCTVAKYHLRCWKILEREKNRSMASPGTTTYELSWTAYLELHCWKFAWLLCHWGMTSTYCDFFNGCCISHWFVNLHCLDHFLLV